MLLVIIESPYAGDVEGNELYLNACLADSLARGEAPFASHGLYTRPGVLDDTKPEERSRGIQAGLAWGDKGDLRAVYTDHGISPGMNLGIDRAEQIGQKIEYRSIFIC